jgi:hypothetical protein
VLYGLGRSSFFAVDTNNTDMAICVQVGEISILELPQIYHQFCPVFPQSERQLQVILQTKMVPVV